MEDGLRDFTDFVERQDQSSLNPCFNGRRFARSYSSSLTQAQQVLILVLMEDGLRVKVSDYQGNATPGLNPCFNGRRFASMYTPMAAIEKDCLNPCFNGRRFARRNY